MEKQLLTTTEFLDIKKTFDCGQCFRWNEIPDENGIAYSGIASNYPAVFTQESGNIYVASGAPLSFWRNYLDLDTDYREADRRFSEIPWLDKCVSYGRGIRILNQDPWEALCSFIISQCNNISRIKGIVEKFSSLYGNPVETDSGIFYTFPSASVTASLNKSDLAPLRCGYRAPYITAAAKAVKSGETDLDYLKACPFSEAKESLKKLPGIGEKVANCAVLFGLHHMEAFPVDVWIKRALSEHFPKDFDPASLGNMAGLAQQYMFYCERESSKGGSE